MISLSDQRATESAERGGAPGASPQGTAPGTGLGALGSLSLVPRPSRQALPWVGRRVLPVGVWDSACAQVPARGKVTQGCRTTRAPSGWAGRVFPAGRRSVGKGVLKGSPASVAEAATHLARFWRGGQFSFRSCHD